MHASGDSEDDEMPCVIGESAGDCVWRGSRDELPTDSASLVNICSTS